jgi:hypothetical protein
MLKRAIILSIIFMFLLPFRSFAAVTDVIYYFDPNSPDYLKKVGFTIWFPAETTQLKVTLKNKDTNEIIFEEYFPAKQGTTNTYELYCQGLVTFQYVREDGTFLSQFDQYLITSDYVDNSACSEANAVKSADPNYPDGGDTGSGDGSGGDGSGGDGTGGDGSGGDGTGGDGSGGDGTGGSGTGDGSGESCSSCDVFSCPGWSDYMGKLNDIAAAIPPAPNWDEVAKTFRDTIVPRLVSDLEDMLGTAPSPPTPPPQPAGVDDGEFTNNTPDMPGNSDLDNAVFDSSDIKNNAPEIPEREDPTGGFDLFENPLDTLPDLPGDDFPKPGETDPGEWGENMPSEPDNPFPNPPSDSGDVNVGDAPTPGDNGATPPNPGGDAGEAPVPGDDSGTPPTPGDSGGDYDGTQYYKPHPDAPDGSGGTSP